MPMSWFRVFSEGLARIWSAIVRPLIKALVQVEHNVQMGCVVQFETY